MLGKQHLLFGTVTGIATVITLNQLGVIDETGMYEFTGMAMLGSLLPDIDMTTSTIGRILKPVSFILSKAIGHRTHSLFFLLKIFLIFSFEFFLFFYLKKNCFPLLEYKLIEFSTFIFNQFNFKQEKEREKLCMT